MENVRKHRDIKLVTTDKKRSILVSEPNYHSSKRISKDLMIIEMKKVEAKMNKPMYLDQAILDISKTPVYKFWYDYIKPKYDDKARLCYTDIDSFVMNTKADDFFKDIADDAESRFDTSNFDKNDNKPLPIGNKKVIGMFKNELGEKIMTESCALRAKAYACKLHNDTELKKAKGTKKCVVKRELMFENYVDASFNDKIIIIRSQQRFRSDHHRVYIEEVNKIALSSNDDKRIQTFDKVTTFPYRVNVFKVCESEILLKSKWYAN